MARIIETPLEFTIICPHCLKRIVFEIEDIRSTYERGLEDSDGWMDFDCLWHYIDCPNCKQTISVDDVIPEDVHKVLTKKYNIESSL
jgi:hypothetical protein